MPIDFETLSIAQLENLVENHRRKRATSAPLWRLVEYGHLKHGVLFSAIVVNKPNTATGQMEPGALKGFVGAARLLQYAVTDEQSFLKEQQARVFAWAQSEPSLPPP